MPSFIYLNPIQPSPVLSSSGQSSEYTVAQYRDVPPPSAGPPPPPAVPYSLYPQLQQVAVSMPPPAPSGLTYYATPNEVLYSGAICSQASQPVNSHESVHYTSSTAMPIAGYTWSPYIPQQVSSPPAGGFVNYFPTAAAYTGAYAASTPLVFQPTTGYSMPPPVNRYAKVTIRGAASGSIRTVGWWQRNRVCLWCSYCAIDTKPTS